MVCEALEPKVCTTAQIEGKLSMGKVLIFSILKPADILLIRKQTPVVLRQLMNHQCMVVSVAHLKMNVTIE